MNLKRGAGLTRPISFNKAYGRPVKVGKPCNLIVNEFEKPISEKLKGGIKP